VVCGDAAGMEGSHNKQCQTGHDLGVAQSMQSRVNGVDEAASPMAPVA
jgi:hypothetical protein